MLRKSSNNSGHFAFTIDEPVILTEIITECRISLPFHPIKDRGKQPPVVKKGNGLWDTGATNCCITKKLADELGLVAIGKANVHHADGDTLKDVYLVNIILPNGIAFPHLTVTECESTAGKFDIIIGMQVITQGDFAITNQQGKTTVSFRIPSNTTIDFNDEVQPPIPKPTQSGFSSKTKVATSNDPYPGTGRNLLCPCGSKKKYKRCHGVNA